MSDEGSLETHPWWRLVKDCVLTRDEYFSMDVENIADLYHSEYGDGEWDSIPAHGRYDDDVYEITYERAREVLETELARIQGTAMSLLRDKYVAKGDGWQHEEPRFHYWKGIDELFSATHFANEGDLDKMDEHLAHGLNHLVMARYLAWRDW